MGIKTQMIWNTCLSMSLAVGASDVQKLLCRKYRTITQPRVEKERAGRNLVSALGDHARLPMARTRNES